MSTDQEPSPGAPLDAAAKQLYELVPDGILVVDTDGTIAHASSRAGVILGYAPAELVGRPIEDLVPEPLRRRHVEHRERYRHAPAARPMGSGLHLVARRSDGSELPVEVSLAPTADASGLVVAGVRDRSEAHRATIALRRSQQRLASLIRSVPATAIFSMDTQGHIIDWNIGAERVTGLSADEAVGQPLGLLYPPAGRAAGDAGRLVEEARSHGVAQQEGWRLRADGPRFFAETSVAEMPAEDGSDQAFAVTVRDSTEVVLNSATVAATAALNRTRTEGDDLSPLLTAVVRLVHSALDPQAVTVTSNQGTFTAGDSAAGSGAFTDVSIGEQGEFGTLRVVQGRGITGFNEAELDYITDVAQTLVRAIAGQRATHDRERLSILEDHERIARDLHDTVIQQIFASGMRLQATSLRINDEGPRSEIGAVIDDLDSCISALRAAIYRLEGNTDEHDIRQKVLDVVARSATTLGFMPAVRFDAPIDVVVPGPVAEDALSTLNELLSNAAKHASAQRIDVVLRIDGELVLAVSDDGTGLIAPPPNSRGRGLRNMEQRAHLHNGGFSWEPGRLHGTVFTWRIPL